MLGAAESSDEQLFAAYQSGDERAFDELFARYTPLLVRTIARTVASTSEVMDLVQQTFLQVHRARFDYDASRALRPWVLTIALNLRRQRDRTRGRWREVAFDGDDAALGALPPVDLDRPREISRLRAALLDLPAQQREVIELHWLEELPFPEVASIVGANVSAVKVRAHRGYGRLRELLARDGAR